MTGGGGGQWGGGGGGLRFKLKNRQEEQMISPDWGAMGK